MSAILSRPQCVKQGRAYSLTSLWHRRALLHLSRGNFLWLMMLDTFSLANKISWNIALLWLFKEKMQSTLTLGFSRSIVNWTIRNKLQWKFNRNSNIFIHKNAIESVVWEMSAILSQPQYVIVWGTSEQSVVHTTQDWMKLEALSRCWPVSHRVGVA